MGRRETANECVLETLVECAFISAKSGPVRSMASHKLNVAMPSRKKLPSCPVTFKLAGHYLVTREAVAPTTYTSYTRDLSPARFAFHHASLISSTNSVMIITLSGLCNILTFHPALATISEGVPHLLRRGGVVVHACFNGTSARVTKEKGVERASGKLTETA